jgi:hypothetical protein
MLEVQQLLEIAKLKRKGKTLKMLKKFPLKKRRKKSKKKKL